MVEHIVVFPMASFSIAMKAVFSETRRPAPDETRAGLNCQNNCPMLDRDSPVRGRFGPRKGRGGNMSKVAKLLLACLLCLAIIVGLVLVAQRVF